MELAPILTVTELEIRTFQSEPGGVAFTSFVDLVLRTHTASFGIPPSDVRTNLRTVLPDGNVDTEVKRACPPLGSFGYLGVPTIWQYKARAYRNIRIPALKKEVSEGYARKMIADGAGYRLCVCDALPAKKINEWEEALSAECRKINPQSPPVRVIDTNALAQWASCFPPIALLFFPSRVAEKLHVLRRWGERACQILPTFVAPSSWPGIDSAIRSHADFTVETPEVILPIDGEAGVGKTRSAYEALRAVPGSDGLVLYTDDDEEAIRIAYFLANNQSRKALLVADECPAATRAELRTILRPHVRRVRVISIDNQGERPPYQSRDLQIEKSSEEQVKKVLEKNYPRVPLDRRIEYARISGGFLQFAAILCESDSRLVSEGHLGSVAPNVDEYLFKLLSTDEMTVIQGLSLFDRIGFAGEISHELDRVCALLKQDRAHFESVAISLHARTGLVGRSGRYLYVTPEIIAQISFARAWQQWVASGPADFLRRVHPGIIEKFQTRVNRSAAPQIRETVAGFFFDWAQGLTPDRLQNGDDVARLANLIELNPSLFLPILADLVETATVEQLENIKGTWIGGGWGPRRTLVWLLERLVRLPEYFAQSEEVLLRLALAESEKDIGNNATAIWKQLFRIYLSGTSTDFDSRLKVLRNRLGSPDESTATLALGGIEAALNTFGTRLVGTVLIAGRLAPDEWSPRTPKQYHDCVSSLLSALGEYARKLPNEKHVRASKVVTTHLRSLLAQGFLPELRTFFSAELLSGTVRAELLNELGSAFEYDAPKATTEEQLKYFARIREWERTLVPPDFHSRVAAVVAVTAWRFGSREEEWLKAIRGLASEISSHPALLHDELDWLFSEDAVSAFYLGHALGQLDSRGEFIDLLLTNAETRKNLGLARGYVLGLSSHSQQKERVKRALDRVEVASANAAFELMVAGGDYTDAITRSLRLVDEKKLPVISLRAFEIGVPGRKLTNEELIEILARLLSVAENDARCREAAISLVAYRLHSGARGEAPELGNELEKMTWRLLEIAATDAGRESFWWNEILKRFVVLDVDAAVAIATRAVFLADRIDQKDFASEVLASIAKSHPEKVMKSVGDLALDRSEGWRFSIGKHTDILYSLPPKVVESWLRHRGIAAARLIARHLPSPFLDDSGAPRVPELTEFVLSKWGEDEKVFNNFRAGNHHLRVYWGSIAEHKKDEANLARRFLDHKMSIIRRWARLEVATADAEAKQFRQMEEEEGMM